MKKRMEMVLAALCLAMLFMGCTDAEQEEPVMISYEQISQEQAKMLMDSESDYVILEYARKRSLQKVILQVQF